MPDFPQSDALKDLFLLLREKSFFTGEFTLASGQKSTYYIDCRLTTLDPQGACLVGAAIRNKVIEKSEELDVTIRGIGGLTLGADPIALASALEGSLCRIAHDTWGVQVHLQLTLHSFTCTWSVP